MKGISIAIETIIYLILGILVLTVLTTFFLTQAGPVVSQAELESKRASLCNTYVGGDFRCAGQGNAPAGNPSVAQDISKTCNELNRRFGTAYLCTGSGSGSAGLQCIQSCCITCPTRPPAP